MRQKKEFHMHDLHWFISHTQDIRYGAVYWTMKIKEHISKYY